ncbi:MAG: DNA replication and repair protein RecF [bacterium]|nr:MAG: DNA replication and repair protein RecF [bacterium]
MRLNWAELDRFRNIEKRRVSLHPRYNLFVGGNGQGKTNFLEGIGYLGTLKSFRSAARSDMVRYGSNMCRVAAEMTAEGITRDISFVLSQRGRSQYLDERRIASPEQYLSKVGVVSFIPEDVGLVSGPPSLRRRAVDRAVFDREGGYVADYRRYLKVLRHRNALLRRGGRADRNELASWTRSLVRDGAVILVRRLHLIRDLSGYLATFGGVLGLTGGVALRYVPSFDSYCETGSGFDQGDPAGMQPSEVEGLLLEGILGAGDRELEAGHSLVGPHRDNVLFTLEGRDMAGYASQGQKRAAVLAFKLALARVISDGRGSSPVILLDDVASELDGERQEALGLLVKDMDAQFLITTTSENPGFLDRQNGFIFSVNGGRIERLV